MWYVKVCIYILKVYLIHRHTNLCFISIYSALNTLSEYTYIHTYIHTYILHIKKHYFIFFCLFLKLPKVFSVSLSPLRPIKSPHRPFSSSLLHAITCSFWKYFHFFIFSKIFCLFLPFLNIFCPFSKNCMHTLAF